MFQLKHRKQATLRPRSARKTHYASHVNELPHYLTTHVKRVTL